MPDYKFYTDTYGGTSLSEANFNRLIKKAGFTLNQQTYGRYLKETATIEADTDLLYAVNMALCNITEISLKAEKRSGIQSENTDGYSVSYSGSDQADIHDCVNMYLNGTWLLSRRIRHAYKCDCDCL